MNGKSCLKSSDYLEGEYRTSGVVYQHKIRMVLDQRIQATSNRLLAGLSTDYQSHRIEAFERCRRDIFSAGGNDHDNRCNSGTYKRLDRMADNRFPTPEDKLFGDRLTGTHSSAGCDHNGGSAGRGFVAGHCACR
jgi:hypothetical protein